MQYKYIFIVLVLGYAGLLTGCSGGKETVCDMGLKPRVLSNAPVGQNQTRTLSLYGVSEGKSYTWSDPN